MKGIVFVSATVVLFMNTIGGCTRLTINIAHLLSTCVDQYSRQSGVTAFVFIDEGFVPTAVLRCILVIDGIALSSIYVV